MTMVQDTNLLSDPALLEKVDRLRDLNIGQHVPLPQLVVVGDQSSGKSSLLESLSGVPFPKDQQLCTRHATQITSRRTNGNEHVEVRIIPGPHSSEEHKKHVSGFSMKLKSSLELKDQFLEILKKANERMGLRADLKSENGTVFSEDVLKIEIHGPREDYLTIIDVPGIFRTTTQGTTKDDMTMVRDLVKSYIKESRTIILAVLPSNVDIATQEILELAEEYDKNGERTIGVLTKPDLVLESGAQDAVCDLVRGNRRPLNLGYFLVRNRGADGNALKQSQLDQFFEMQPWKTLPHHRLGITALKAQLSTLLLDITRQFFPQLGREINEQIKECNKELNSLGPPRQDEREQRSFLNLIAGAFQDRVRAALSADYNADAAFDEDELRLITRIANITEVFSADFQKKAHSRPFALVGVSEPSTPSNDFSNSDSEDDEAMVQKVRLLLQRASLDDLRDEEPHELGDIMIPPPLQPIAPQDITEWIEDVYLRSRGLDLGTFNPNFVSVAFAEQSRKWGQMTWTYMRRCIIALHRFIGTALRSVWPDPQGRGKLWAAIVGSLVERYKAAIEQADLLIEVERRKKPYTLNPQFAKALSKARGNRIAELLKPTARKDQAQYGEVQYMVNLDDIPKVAQEKRNMEQLQEKIHDILQAYYQLALDRFIDNIFQLAVGFHLLHGPSNPLNVFNQDWVINLSPEELERIVGETKSAKSYRTRLTRKIGDFNKAIDIIRS
ncbi:hypothetical protein PFICI_02374 [Pestalotiopsis fici W106-1]|uniref:Uncharacterized protein n=1 Tax=Pestalotiopsis fici (strain W106-1 / CGMCC3.15140) TaxID=1229662 RepID=W3XEA7_PESFW|nr:uncharacterized protein PFICI_02374 [Pestalotiopsis fici W106-1]ETS84349.1 hypothetical protein PFICI_02374 [Pestalotiopsis fici W106-1]